jgi:UDP-N-acetylmuramoylalanine--D-glutamate ligase
MDVGLDLMELDDSPAGNFGFDVRGKRVAVVGLGRLSGVAAVRTLCELGAKVVVNDARPSSEHAEALAELASYPSVRDVDYVFGSHPASVLEGVELVVLSPGVPYDLPLLERARAVGIATIGELELAFRLSRSEFVAVTGTKGKTTTTTLLGAMLEGGLPVKVCVAGNIGVPLSLKVRELGSRDLVVAEVSSFQLESIVEFRPHVALVVNITADHLDRHRTMDAYIAAKRRIVENQRPDDLLVVNADDALACQFAGLTRARVREFSMTHPVAEGGFLDGDALVWRANGDARTVARVSDIGVPGRHNIANALAAMTVALSLGAPSKAVVAALRAFRGIEHAYEPVGRVRDVLYINDSKATNVAAVKAALDATHSGKVVLIVGGVDKGNEYDDIIPAVRETVRHLVLLGTDVRRLREAFTGVVPLTVTGSMKEAVAVAASVAEAGDTVLLSPGHASFDLFANWKERGNAFKQAVRELG